MVKTDELNFSAGSIVGMYKTPTPDGKSVELFDKDRYLKALYANKEAAQQILNDIQVFINDKDLYVTNADNKKVTDKAIGELKSYIGVLSKLENKVLRNVMVENTIQVLFDSNNLVRMTTPISTEFIDGSPESNPNSIKGIFSALGIADARFDFEPNLSLRSDSQKMFKNIFDGASLTGIFANSVKVLSYITRSG
jgi:hypothetical protein